MLSLKTLQLQLCVGNSGPYLGQRITRNRPFHSLTTALVVFVPCGTMHIFLSVPNYLSV